LLRFTADGHSDNWTSEHASDRFNHIVWQEAEALMRGATSADIFLILDCCYAGRLVNMRSRTHWSERIFEFLGACAPDSTTPLPGKESFTAALIWALEELADANKSFSSAELRDKICEYKHKSPDQLPCMSDRVPCLRKLILEPLPDKTDEAVVPEHSPLSGNTQTTVETPYAKYALKLHFLLTDFPDDDEIRMLCEGLKAMIQDGKISANQVLWKGLYDVKEELSAEMVRFVDRYAMKWQNQTLKQKIKRFSQTTIDMTGQTLLNVLPIPAPSETSLGDSQEESLDVGRQLATPPSGSQRPAVMKAVFLAFLLFFTLAAYLCLALLFDMRNLVASLLLIGKNFSRRQGALLA
jgi:hypothetical protein